MNEGQFSEDMVKQVLADTLNPEAKSKFNLVEKLVNLHTIVSENPNLFGEHAHELSQILSSNLAPDNSSLQEVKAKIKTLVEEVSPKIEAISTPDEKVENFKAILSELKASLE